MLGHALRINHASRASPRTWPSRGQRTRLFSTSTPEPLRANSHTYTTPNTPPRPRSTALSFLLLSAASLTFYTLGTLYPPPLALLLAPRPAPPPPDPSLPSTQAYLHTLEHQLLTLPLLEQMRGEAKEKGEDTRGEWYETRPFRDYPEERRVNSLTQGALRGPGLLALLPLIRARRDESEAVFFLHLGRGLCGHDGIVHGGLLATVLDEALARTAILNLPEKVGVTAKLEINYRKPALADGFVVVRTRLVEGKGRKVVVEGAVEDMKGNVLTEARATFVQPKYAKLLNASAVRRALGEPEEPASVPEPTIPGKSALSAA